MVGYGRFLVKSSSSSTNGLSNRTQSGFIKPLPAPQGREPSFIGHLGWLAPGSSAKTTLKWQPLLAATNVWVAEHCAVQALRSFDSNLRISVVELANHGSRDWASSPPMPCRAEMRSSLSWAPSARGKSRTGRPARVQCKQSPQQVQCLTMSWLQRRRRLPKQRKAARYQGQGDNT